MATWSALPFLLFHAGGLLVDTPSPDSFCPALEQTRQVVASRLGTVELEGTWQATYVSVHRTSGEYVALTLRDPTGAVRLEREFPVQEGSCLTLSQVIALVLERYFSRPELPQEAPAPAPLPITPLPTATGRSETNAQTNLSSPSTPAERAPLSTATPKQKDLAATSDDGTRAEPPSERSAFQASLGISATTGWIGPWLALGVAISPKTSLALGGGYDWLDHDEPVSPSPKGKASARRVPLTLTLSRQVLSGESIRLQLGGGMLGVIERGRTTGLALSRAETRLVPGLTALLTAYFLKDSAFLSPFISAQAALQFEALTGEFEIDGKRVLSPPAFSAGGLFGVQLRF